MTEAPFVVGDEVEVWSNSRKIWFVGEVEDIAPPGGVGTVCEGCVKVRFGRKLEKWILPQEFGRVLRRHAPRFYVPDPGHPPRKLMQDVRARWYANRELASLSLFSAAPATAKPQLTMDMLVDMWKTALIEENPGLAIDASEMAQIRQNVADIFRAAGCNTSGRVSVDDFVHFGLLTIFPPGKAVKAQIANELANSRSSTQSYLVSSWMNMDLMCSGRIRIDDLEQALTDAGVGGWDVEDEAKGIVHDIDGDNFASVAYCDFVAKYFGMNCVEVSLSWYDISNGWSKYITPLVLWQQEGGIWHTGVVVFSQEFYYSGRIYRGRPGATPYGFPKKIQRLGLTSRSHKEFENFIIQDLDSNFTEDKYDFLEHNCNNFTNQAVYYLLNDQIPEEIRLQPTRAMNAPLAMMFRPWVNQWLGRIEGDPVVANSGGSTTSRLSTSSVTRQARQDDIIEGCTVLYSPQGVGNTVEAQVLRKHPQGSCDIRWSERSGNGSMMYKEAKHVPIELLQLTHKEEESAPCIIS